MRIAKRDVRDFTVFAHSQSFSREENWTYIFHAVSALLGKTCASLFYRSNRKMQMNVARLPADQPACGGIEMSTVKEELTRLIEGQPEDSTREEIVRELAFHLMVERGLADSDARRTISNEEMQRRIRSWRK